MNTKPKKVKVTLSITKEAQDTMLDNGYASVRTMGMFISQLIVDYHERGPGSHHKRKTERQSSSGVASS